MHDDPHRVLGVAEGATREELRRARRRLARELHPDTGTGDGARMAAVNAAFDRLAGAERFPTPAAAPGGPAEAGEIGFAVDVLPVMAFHFVLAAAAELGEILLAEPPYEIEGYLRDPSPCLCRMELFPDAGGTTILVQVEPGEGGEIADRHAVLDRLVAVVSALGERA